MLPVATEGLGPLLCLVLFSGWACCPAASAATRHWVVTENDCQFRLLEHRRGESPGAPPQEELKYEAGSGRAAYLLHELRPLPVIAELAIEVPFRATRPGVQLLARVVLPRVRDSRTGQPLRLLLQGTAYAKPHAWQPLSLRQLDSALQKQVYLLRSQPGRGAIDPREAYVDGLVLNLYVGRGQDEAWIGDPTFEGAAPAGVAAHRPSPELSPETGSDAAETPETSASSTSPWQVQGDLVLLQGRPTVVRAVEARGESWRFLQQLGFNAIYLRQEPSLEECARAEQLQLWIIAPPPRRWSHTFRRVAAWDLTPVMSAGYAATLAELAEDVRGGDPMSGRPLLGTVDDLPASGERSLDILARAGRLLAWQLDASQPRRWWLERSQRGQQTRPHWAFVPTEPPREVQQQREAFAAHNDAAGMSAGAAAEPLALEPVELHRWVVSTVTLGVRGLIFRSQRRLDENSRTARLRATSLRLLNLQLETISPWVAVGSAEATAACDDPDYELHVLRNAHASLAIPIWQGATSAGGKQDCESSPLPIGVQGVPLAAEAFSLGAMGLVRTPVRHEAGGCRFLLDGTDPWRVAVISREPLVLNAMERRLAECGPATAELTRQLAEELLGWTEATAGVVPRAALRRSQSREIALSAAASLHRASASFDQGDFATMYREAAAALWRVTLARARLRAAVAVPAGDGIPQVCCDLSGYWAARESSVPAAFGVNCLPAGGLEDTAAMRQAGWQTLSSGSDRSAADVQLVAEDPREGRYYLRMHAAAQPLWADSPAPEPPRVRLHSPRVPLPPGCLVRISGWWRVTPAARVGDVEAVFFDSLGGPGLAPRVQSTEGWQPIELLRAASGTQPLVLTVGLTGAGQIDLDDMQVRVMERPWRAGPAGTAELPVAVAAQRQRPLARRQRPAAPAADGRH